MVCICVLCLIPDSPKRRAANSLNHFRRTIDYVKKRMESLPPAPEGLLPVTHCQPPHLLRFEPELAAGARRRRFEGDEDQVFRSHSGLVFDYSPPTTLRPSLYSMLRRSVAFELTLTRA